MLSNIWPKCSHRFKQHENKNSIFRITLIENACIGFSNSSLDLDSVMKFALSALEHPSGPVRDDASKIITETYRMVGSPVRAYFPDEQGSSKLVK